MSILIATKTPMQLDGIWHKVNITDIGLSSNIIDGDAAGRNRSTGNMLLDPIGTYYGHSVVAMQKDFDYNSFRDLWYNITDPNKIHTVTMPDIQGWITYEAYCRIANTKILRVDLEQGNHLCDTMTFNIIPMNTQRRA